MQRRFLPLLWAFTLLFISLQALGSAAAATYIVAPFQVSGPDGYAYLGRSIPSSLSTSLFWDGHFVPAASQDKVVQGPAPKNEAEAKQLLASNQADYIIWGKLQVSPPNSTMLVQAMGQDGRSWSKEITSSTDRMSASLMQAGSAVSEEVFGRPVQRQAQSQQRTVAPMNPDFMVNENQAGTVYLNPQLRYQGADVDRVRSQRVEIESRGMEVADFNGDGRNEIILFDENNLYLYIMEGTSLRQLDSFQLPASYTPLTLRSAKQGNRRLLVLPCLDSTSKDGLTMIFTVTNNKFEVLEKRLPYYCSVTKIPPFYEEIIIGQSTDRTRITRGSIFEVMVQGGSFVKGPNLPNMPTEANVFNFSWVPGNQYSSGDYLVVVGEFENLLTFDNKGRRLAKTDEKYSAGTVGMMNDRSMPGVASSSKSMHDPTTTYYVPIRMIPVDLDKDRNYELVVSKPVTTAGELFGNYRTYPQGEIHALVWDGIGMDLLWKTRRIKGTVIDLTIADADNDGVLDLVVNVNTYPGALGAGKIRSLVTLYPLDLSQADPNTPYSPEF